MASWRPAARALVVVLAGIVLGDLWVFLGWTGLGLPGGVFGIPGFLLVFVLLGALAQPWLSPGETAALAAAALAARFLALANTTEGDEEHYGHEAGTVLLITRVVIGAAVVLALAAHALVGALRQRASRPAP